MGEVADDGQYHRAMLFNRIASTWNGSTSHMPNLHEEGGILVFDSLQFKRYNIFHSTDPRILV